MIWPPNKLLLTMLLHDRKELYDDLWWRTNEDLTLSATLSVDDWVEGIVEDRNADHFVWKEVSQTRRGTQRCSVGSSTWDVCVYKIRCTSQYHDKTFSFIFTNLAFSVVAGVEGFSFFELKSPLTKFKKWAKPSSKRRKLPASLEFTKMVSKK